MDFTISSISSAEGATITHAPAGDVIRFPKEEIITLRSASCGCVAIPWCGFAIKHDVFVHFVRQNDDVSVRVSAASCCRSSAENLTARLCGVLTMIIRVRGVIAARTSSQFTAKSARWWPDGNRRCSLQTDNRRVAVKEGSK